MRILVMGAGAVGGYFGSLLIRGGQNVTLVARGPHLDAMKRNGLVIKSRKGDFVTMPTATDDPSGLGEFDIVLVAVKSFDTYDAIKTVKGNVGDGTTVISLQNGVENEDILTKAFKKEDVVGAVTYIGAEVVEPGVIAHHSAGRISLGDLPGTEAGSADRIAAELSKAGLDVRLSTDIVREKWQKLAFNAAFNSVSALTNSTFAEVAECELSRNVAVSIVNEGMMVASIEGLDLPQDTPESALRLAAALGDARSSMLSDRIARRRMELDALIGVIVRKGKEHGVLTPASETAFRLLCHIDSEIRRQAK
ncbi:MAG: 2-dehydropantoate 2-reductase [Methanomassiliicoccales archaeon]|nr:2-dehydropantoate 2-reductase [Methanomassiliicoccales archaeon]